MPGTIKITDLTALAAASLQSDDVLVIVDVHDTTMAPTGTDKKILVSSLFTNPGQFLAANGSAAAPAYAFTNDPDCGFYRIAANRIGLALNGSQVGDWATTGLTITGTLIVSSSITASGGFAGDGSAITGLNASSLAGGTVPSARVSGSYTGITGVGTIAAGTWQGTAIADTYLATIATAGKVSNSATTATSANTASAIVARDGSGNFTAGTITANLTGNVTGNAATATKLQTARTINGVSFDGTANIIVSAATVGTLTFGTYLQAGDPSFSGSAATISTNATSAATASTLVARDGSAGIAVAALTATTVGATGVISTSSASNVGFLATTTANSTFPYYRLATPNRSYWLSAIDTGADADLKIGSGNTIGSSVLWTLSASANSLTISGSMAIGGALSGATTGAFSSNVTVGGTLGVTGRITPGADILLSTSVVPATPGQIGFSSTYGVYTYAKTGGTDDWALFSAAGGYVMHVPTGTTTASFAGAVTVAGQTTVADGASGNGIKFNGRDAGLFTDATTLYLGRYATGDGIQITYATGVANFNKAVTMQSTLGVTGAVTGGTYNGQTISSAASFTGTVAVAGITSLSEALALVGNGTGAAGRIYKSAAIGTVIWGAAGSVNDFTLTNSAGGTVFGVPTGTTTAAFSGAITTTSTTDSTSTTTGSIQTSGGLGVVKSVVVGGTVTAAKYKGSGTPGISTSAGAGTSPTATLATNSNDAFGAVNFTAGTSPNGNNAMVTVTYSAAYSTAPFPTITEASSGAVVGGIYLFSYDVNGFTISMTNPSNGIIANYSYHIGQ